MRDLPLPERPRERLLHLGSSALSNRELLAIVIGSGGPGASALELADRILRSTEGSLRRLGTAGPTHLARIPGVGMATAGRVLAAVELGRRALREASPERLLIRGPEDVFRFMAPRLRDQPQEEFHTLVLNAQHRVVRDVLVTRGILDASLVHPREVFRPAIEESAAAVILVHNHPSGDPTPSREDRQVTRQLAVAGQALGIHVLDHVVIADGGWRSLGSELPQVNFRDTS